MTRNEFFVKAVMSRPIANFNLMENPLDLGRDWTQVFEGS